MTVRLNPKAITLQMLGGPFTGHCVEYGSIPAAFYFAQLRDDAAILSTAGPPLPDWVRHEYRFSERFDLSQGGMLVLYRYNGDIEPDRVHFKLGDHRACASGRFAEPQTVDPARVNCTACCEQMVALGIGKS
jgi:hypothetical protein